MLMDRNFNLYFKNIDILGSDEVISRLETCVQDYDLWKNHNDSTAWDNHKTRYDVSIGDLTCYIDDIHKVTMPTETVGEKQVTPFFVVMNIAGVDTSEEVAYANIQKSINNRKTKAMVNGTPVDQDVNTGPIKSMRLLIDPFRKVMLTRYSNEGFSTIIINKLLNSLFESDAISYGFILDVNNMEDMKRLTNVKKFEYKIKMLMNTKVFTDNGKSESGDLELAEAAGADTYTVSLKSPLKQFILDKAQDLFQTEGIEVKKMIAVGDSINGAENIDMLRKKLHVGVTVQYQKGTRIKDIQFMDVFEKAYCDKYKRIKNTFAIVI